MQDTIIYNEILEDAEKLTLEEQESLVNVLHHRLIDEKRKGLAEEIQAVRQEYQEGKATVGTVDDIVKEIFS